VSLDQLAARLKRQPMTARQIAEAFNVARPTAYEWIRKLTARGESVFEIRTRASKRTGPRPVVYGIR
jgi:transposase